MKQFLILDIETGPLPADMLSSLVPEFEAPSNYKAEQAIADYKAKKLSEWSAEHALHAHRGQILAVGILHSGLEEPDIIHASQSESDIVTYALDMLTHSWTNKTIVGHNIFGFDLPYLCRRALLLGIPVPSFLRQALRSYWPPPEIFDTMKEWGMTDRTMISLDHLAWAFGVGRKNGKGAEFAQLYAENRDEALAYVANDLALCKAIYLKMHP